MARQPLRPGKQRRTGIEIMPLTWPYVLERVAGIEPALSAWEAQRSRLPGTLTWRPWRSWVTVADPLSPWLMAR
jgi:hypothetical protein